MKATFIMNGYTYKMFQIPETDMDRVLKDNEIASYPQYFDARKRVWPLPAEGIKVEFTE